jgi:hypothetical protein
LISHCANILTRPTPRAPRRALSPSSPARPRAIFFPPTRPTDCFAIDYPGRALFPGGDGETQCSKIDSGKTPDRSSLRSQGVTPPCGFTPRVSSNGLSTSAPKLTEPSSSGAVRFHLSLKQWLHVQPPPFREHKRLTGRPASLSYTGRGARADGLITTGPEIGDRTMRSRASWEQSRPSTSQLYWGQAQPVFSPQRI